MVAVLAPAGALVAVILMVLSADGKERKVEVGTLAPELAGEAVRGDHVNLMRLHGHVVLLSFVDLRADTNGDDRSRRQIVFLRSMQTQHRRFGLRAILVDTARQSPNELLNDTYDWNLDPQIAVLPDDGTLARRFGVHEAPTTFLIGRRGVVRKRWNGFAAAAQLDFAVRSVERRSPAG
jgi:peroxiredoxin